MNPEGTQPNMLAPVKVERNRIRRRKQFERNVEKSGAGVLVFAIMGNMLVKAAARSEANPRIRRARVERLNRIWKQYTSEEIGIKTLALH